MLRRFYEAKSCINKLDTYFINAKLLSEDPTLSRQEKSDHQQINSYMYEYRNISYIIHFSVVHLQNHTGYILLIFVIKVT
jgi:hypothetical protein